MCAFSFGFGKRGQYHKKARQNFPGPGRYDHNHHIVQLKEERPNYT